VSPGAILLVDAEEEARAVLAPFLARCGPVRVACTLAEGRDALAAAAPEILVLDPELPDGDGTALITAVRAQHAWAQTLVACRPGWHVRTAALIAAGASDLVLKPFDVGTLPLRVTRLQRAGRTLRDEITRRERLEARLAHAERVTTLGTAAATMAHEIANPLTTVTANASYLREALAADAPLDRAARAEACEAVAAIARAAGMMEVFIARVRGFSRRGEQEKCVAPLADVVDWALTLLGPRLRERGVVLTLPARPAPTALHEPVRLTQALLNALTNALEAVAPGGSVALEYVDEDDVAGLCVEDDGAGVSDALLARLGEPFFSTKATGTGLGMAVIHEVMAEHGGRAELGRGARGRGLRVRLLLPR
jgi:signal transduction histidine kinase